MRNIKKVEIIFEAIYLKKVVSLLKKHKITKYSLIRDIEGSGSHGLMLNDSDLSDVGANDYIISLCEEEEFESLKEELRSFTKRFGGKCFVSDVNMLL
jgi:nitrogen regulatory protein PII